MWPFKWSLNRQLPGLIPLFVYRFACRVRNAKYLSASQERQRMGSRSLLDTKLRISHINLTESCESRFQCVVGLVDISYTVWTRQGLLTGGKLGKSLYGLWAGEIVHKKPYGI